MAYELLSSKIYTPYVGGSLYVWTAILTITLLGLALGYRKGDSVTDENLDQKLFLHLLITTIFIGLSVLLAKFILPMFYGMENRIASLMCGIVLLLVPMYLLGTISPMLIRKISNESNRGSASGMIYGISTIGGVVLSMFFVFIMIPSTGVEISIYCIAGLLLLSSLLLKFNK